MTGNTSEEFFDDFIRSHQRNWSLRVPMESSQDTDDSEVVVVAEKIPDFSNKNWEFLVHFDCVAKYDKDQEVFDKIFIDETKRYPKLVKARCKARIKFKQSTLSVFCTRLTFCLIASIFHPTR